MNPFLPQLTMEGIIQALAGMRPQQDENQAAPTAGMVGGQGRRPGGGPGGSSIAMNPMGPPSMGPMGPHAPKQPPLPQGPPAPPSMQGPPSGTPPVGPPPSSGGPMAGPAPSSGPSRGGLGVPPTPAANAQRQAAASGPPQVDPMQVAPTSIREEYGDAMLDYQRAFDAQSPFERFLDGGKQRSAVQKLVKAQDKMDRFAASAQVREAQKRADSTYGLALAATGNPNTAKQIAQLAIQDPDVAKKLAEQVAKPITPAEMEKEYNFIQSIEDDEERAIVFDKWLKKGEQIVKLPAQFGWEPDGKGGLRMVPGGPADLENKLRLAELAEKRWQSVVIYRKAQQKVDESLRQVKRSLGLVGPGTTGLIGSFMSQIPGTDARNLQELLITQQAGIAFEALREMREASSTGGALGNVSNREIELLYNSFAALNQDMDEDELRRSLTDVMMKYEGMKFALANEQKWEKAYAAGEISEQDIFQAINENVNDTMRRETGVNQADWDHLQKNPETMNKFVETYGWVPRMGSNLDWEGYKR